MHCTVTLVPCCIAALGEREGQHNSCSVGRWLVLLARPAVTAQGTLRSVAVPDRCASV